MKVILSKNMNIVEALDDLKEVLVREYDGYGLKVSSGSLYLNFSGHPELKELEFTLSEGGLLEPVEKVKEAAGTEQLKGIVIERIKADIVKAERQLIRDKKKYVHAKNMLSSSIEHGRKEATISSWKIEKDTSYKERLQTEGTIKHLRAFLACLEDRDSSNRITWHSTVIREGYHRGRTGSVLLLSYPTGESLLYSYRGLRYLPKGTTSVDAGRFSDQLILVPKDGA